MQVVGLGTTILMCLRARAGKELRLGTAVFLWAPIPIGTKWITMDQNGTNIRFQNSGSNLPMGTNVCINTSQHCSLDVKGMCRDATKVWAHQLCLRAI